MYLRAILTRQEAEMRLNVQVNDSELKNELTDWCNFLERAT